MYIQITTRCNMTCAHCCYACTEKGDDMSIETFKKVLEHADGYISIGGGEPTIHPQFWEIIGLALGNTEGIWLAINGKKKDTAIALANLAKRGVLACELSQDEFHDAIDEQVIEAFEREKPKLYIETDDLRGIRNVSQYYDPIKSGRCDWGREDQCVCDDLFVCPDGTVKACGCEDSLIFGNVNTEVNIPDDWEHGTCYKQQPEYYEEDIAKLRGEQCH